MLFVCGEAGWGDTAYPMVGFLDIRRGPGHFIGRILRCLHLYIPPPHPGCSIAQRGTPSIFSLTGISLASSVLGLNGGRELAHSHLVCDFDLILLFLVRFSPPPPPPALPGWERDSYTSICGCEGQDTWDPAPCKFFNQTCHFQGHSKSFLASKISLASLIYFISSSTHFFSGGFMLAEIIL